MAAKKGEAGEVAIENFRGRLRLRWRWNKQQKTLTIGADTSAGRAIANSIAAQIRLDILTKNYDETLKRYQLTPEVKRTPIEILEAYHRSLPSTSDKHRAIANHVRRDFADRDAAKIDPVEARVFLSRLKTGPATHNAYLIILRAAWTLAQIDPNPWIQVKALQVAAGKADPFTSSEVDRILDAFQESFYLPYVKALFATGCRPGEISALTWGDVQGEDLLINKSWCDRSLRVKPTKTGRDRRIPITPGLRELLLEIGTEGRNPVDLIFPSKQGKHLSAKTFLRRHWMPALKKAEVRYRSTYRTRHTVWSHTIAAGVSIVDAAEMAGNSPETMTRHYLGSVKRSEIRDLL